MIEFLGTKTISMLCGVIAATVISIKFLGLKKTEESANNALQSAGLVFLITGADGAFAAVITASGVNGAMFGATVNDSGFWIVTNMCGFNFSGGVKTYMLGEAIASVVGIILIVIVGLISTLIL